MTRKLHRGFLLHYGLVLLLSAMIALIAYAALDFAGSILAGTLVKNRHPAKDLLADDIHMIDASGVVQDGGGVQVINEAYQIVFSSGLDVFQKSSLTAAAFTDFLTGSRAVGVPYSHDVAYSQEGRYWLIVTFPTSLRMDFALAHNTLHPSRDTNAVIGAIVATAILYLLLLSLAAAFSSRLTALTVTRPLNKLCQSTRRLKEGDLSARVDLRLKNEFLELQETFNAMAQKLQDETRLKEQAEANRRQLVLDISHDLKNPLAAILGYAEYGLAHAQEPMEDKQAHFLAIRDNARRAGSLISGLFELSKLESPEYRIAKKTADICEYMRQICAQAIPALDDAGFTYDFDIPETQMMAELDEAALDRVFQNLFDNAIKYNPAGTKVTVSLKETQDTVEIAFQDNGIGMHEEFRLTIFQPFVRADSARSSRTGGTGLGLAIARQIITLHGGSISLSTSPGNGCDFSIRLPKA